MQEDHFLAGFSMALNEGQASAVSFSDLDTSFASASKRQALENDRQLALTWEQGRD